MKLKRKDIIVKCRADTFMPLAAMFGICVIMHGDSSPGGGFQGGEQQTSLPGGGFHGGEQQTSLPGGGFHHGDERQGDPSESWQKVTLLLENGERADVLIE